MVHLHPKGMGEKRPTSFPAGVCDLQPHDVQLLKHMSQGKKNQKTFFLLVSSNDLLFLIICALTARNGDVLCREVIIC